MAILRTDRDEEARLSCYEAMVRIEGGLNAHHGKPPTIDFEADAVVLCSSEPINLDCRGATWEAEQRESAGYVVRKYFAAIETGGRGDAEAPAFLTRRYGGVAVSGPVPLPRARGVFHRKPLAALPLPATSSSKPTAPAPRTFRADIVKALVQLQSRIDGIERTNREVANDKSEKQRDLRAAQADYIDKGTPAAVEAVTKAETELRLAILRASAKTTAVPNELLTSLAKARDELQALDGSQLALLTNAHEGRALAGFDELRLAALDARDAEQATEEARPHQADQLAALQLTASDLKYCRLTGCAPADFLATKQRMASEDTARGAPV